MSGHIEALDARLTDAEADLTRLGGEVAEMSAAMHSDNGQAPAAAATMFTTVEEWVGTYFAVTFGRPLGGECRWCPRWFEHHEAVERLTALWRSWEALRRDETLGMVTWLTHNLDPQLSALLARTGPFAQCSLDRHTDQRGLDLA